MASDKSDDPSSPDIKSDINGNIPVRDKQVPIPTDGELLHMLLDTIPDSIYFKDLESKFLRVSRWFLEKAGYAADTTVFGKTDFDFFTSEHAQQAYNDEQTLLKTGKPIVGLVEKETWPDRPDSWVSSTKMPFTNKAGKIIGTFGISRDITEVKQYRDELQKAKDELEERVLERTIELSDAKFQLEQHVEQLKFLNHTAYKLARITDINELFTAIGDSFQIRFPFAHIGVYQKTKEIYKCVYSSRSLDTPAIKELIENTIISIIKDDVRQPLVLEPCHHVKLTKEQFSFELEENMQWLLFPLVSDNQLLAAVLLLVPVKENSIFSEEQTLLSTLSAHAATCLLNALHYKHRESKARIEGELEAARLIQQNLMPHKTPDIPGMELMGKYLPAHEVGGDYLDYFQAGNGSWVIIIADVCGKGVPAAMLMSVLRSIARVEARTNFSAKSLLCAINNSICLNLNERSFITALALIIDPEKKSMTYARAGHPKLLWYDSALEKIHAVDSKGLALGIVEDVNEFADYLEELTLPLTSGDSFLAYSDGLTEAVDEYKNPYGQQRLTQKFLEFKEGNAEHIINGLLSDIRLFTKNSPASDDQTIMTLKIIG